VDRLLAGSWRYVAGGGESLPAHTMTFTPFGDLVQSSLGEEGVESRVLLMYEVDGDALVLDHPGAPEPERRPYVVDGDELRLGGPDDLTTFHREPEDELSDPDAYMLALASGALHLALSSVVESETESFDAFLISDTLEARKVRRILAPDVHIARAAAQNTMTTLGPDVRAAAFAFQGVVEIEGEPFDAAVVEVSQRGRLYGLLLGQPFGRNEEGHLVRVTDLDVETNENWFEVDHTDEDEGEEEDEDEEEGEEPRKPAKKKVVAKKAIAKKAVAKKAIAKKSVAKKAVAKKAVAKKAVAKKAVAKKAVAKKAVAKKAVAKKPAAKKVAKRKSRR
jgi:Histone H1-like nucleoprotein HC2